MQHLKVRGNTWLATNQIKILCMQGNISTTFMFSFHGNIISAVSLFDGNLLSLEKKLYRFGIKPYLAYCSLRNFSVNFIC
jgi:hypothetical protein